MAKITISQLHTADAASIQELTNAELDTTKGGLGVVLAPTIGLSNTALLGQNKTVCSDNAVGTNILQNLVNVFA